MKGEGPFFSGSIRLVYSLHIVPAVSKKGLSILTLDGDRCCCFSHNEQMPKFKFTSFSLLKVLCFYRFLRIVFNHYLMCKQVVIVDWFMITIVYCNTHLCILLLLGRSYQSYQLNSSPIVKFASSSAFDVLCFFRFLRIEFNHYLMCKQVVIVDWFIITIVYCNTHLCILLFMDFTTVHCYLKLSCKNIWGNKLVVYIFKINSCTLSHNWNFDKLRSVIKSKDHGESFNKWTSRDPEKFSSSGQWMTEKRGMA